MYAYLKLKKLIIKRCGSVAKFSEAIGSKTELVEKKLACESGLSRSDIECWAEELGIPKEEWLEYFFE